MEGLGSFGAFAGWQTAALKANRKPLLWPWPGALGACWGRCLEGLDVLEGLDGVFGGFRRFWRVWGVLERLRAGKRQL